MLRFESWMGWLFNFALGAVLFTLFSSVHRFISFSLAFMLATSGIFVLNQYFDYENDRKNSLKKDLPISNGDVSPKTALYFSILLTLSSLCCILYVDVSLLPLFMFYLGLWICYSAPPLYLKSRPILDIIVAGVGSGVLPFIIGLQVSNQLSFDLSLPWVRRFYLDAFLSIIPLLLFQSAGHIFQAIGDYEADSKVNINTFVVKYGKNISIKLAELFLVISALLPIIFFSLNLSLTNYLNWYMTILIFCIPFMYYLINTMKNPTTQTISRLRRVSQKISPPILFIIWIYVLILRSSL
jgi:4-hydroxybenzoate polyprenyltransferase